MGSTEGGARAGPPARRRPGGRRTGGRDGFQGYLRSISRAPLLTRQREGELARRIREGDQQALDELVTRNLRFVVAVARRYRGGRLGLPDLVNAGNLGLIEAARRFDGDRGVRFVTYASWWIRQAILRALDAEARGRPPDSGSGAGGRPGEAVSLDAPGPSGTGSLLERLADSAVEPPDQRVLRGALRDAVRRSLAGLPAREADALRMCFGLDGRGRRSLAEVAEGLGVSRSRVRQLRDRGLERLRRGKAGTVLAGFRD